MWRAVSVRVSVALMSLFCPSVKLHQKLLCLCFCQVWMWAVDKSVFVFKRTRRIKVIPTFLSMLSCLFILMSASFYSEILKSLYHCSNDTCTAVTDSCNPVQWCNLLPVKVILDWWAAVFCNVFLLSLDLRENIWGTCRVQNLHGCRPAVSHQEGNLFTFTQPSLRRPQTHFDFSCLYMLIHQGWNVSTFCSDTTGAVHAGYHRHHQCRYAIRQWQQ